jgi:uncharacterized protein YndB with AHSA1/START domain
MGIKTHGSIDIDAPPQRVFEWIVDRKRVAKWAGAEPDYLPDDPAKLGAGYRGTGSMAAPDGKREVDFEVTGYEPPTHLAYRVSYDGGDAESTFTLTPSGEGTHLETSSDTEYAQMGKIPEQAEARLAGLPKAMQLYVHHQIHEMEEQLESGAWDDNPQVKAAMQGAVDQGLARLKQLAEAG